MLPPLINQSEIMIIKSPFYLLISLTLFFLFLIRLISLYLDPTQNFITVIPDDAFYYLKLAKNYSHFGEWTFDGQNSTTGFHPLWANLLRLFFYENKNLIDFRIMFLIIGLISSTLISISLYIFLISIEKLFNTSAALFSAAPFFSYPIILQSTSLMESPLVIFICSLTLFAILDRDLNWRKLILIFILGIIGSLTRSDYMVFFLPVSLSLAFTSLHVKEFFKENKAIIIKSIILVLGGFAGLIILAINNYEISGKFSQGSAEIKYFWSHIVGHSPIPALKILFSLIIPIQINIYISFTIITLLIILLLIIHRRFTALQLGFIFASVISIAIYLSILSLNSQSIQSWYSANLLIPAGLILSSIGFIYLKSKSINIIILLSYMIGGLYYSNLYIERHQIGMLNGAIYLRDKMPQNQKYAAWNAGILGFFSDKNVVNLDGLVNDNVIYYIKNNELWNYIEVNNIDYIIDYGEMFTNTDPWKLETRGGHDDDRFHRCIRPGKIIDDGEMPWINFPLRIYEIDKNCNKL